MENQKAQIVISQQHCREVEDAAEMLRSPEIPSGRISPGHQFYHPDLHNRPDKNDMGRVVSFVEELHQRSELVSLIGQKASS